MADATTAYPDAPALSRERLTVGPRHVVFEKRGVVRVLDLGTGRLGGAPYDGRISEVTIAGDRLVATASGEVVLSASTPTRHGRRSRPSPVRATRSVSGMRS